MKRILLIVALLLVGLPIEAQLQKPTAWLCGYEQLPGCDSGLFYPICANGYRVVDEEWPYNCSAPAICWNHCTLDHGPTPEPDCDCEVPPLGQEDPYDLWGFADIHAHQFTNEGFGGVAHGHGCLPVFVPGSYAHN